MATSLLLPLTVALAAYKSMPSSFEVPKVNLTDITSGEWWGPADKQANQDTAIHCARIKYEEDMVEDLKMRLRKTKTNVQPLEGEANFIYGFNQKNIGNLTDFWLNKYDFDAQEEYWNKYPLYKTNIQGLDIFFYRITPQVDENTELVPLMILHGWPSSPLEFFDAIPLLTEVSKERGFAFDLIVPCLAGFGFSEGTVRPGLGAVQMAVVMRNLMHRIGYKKFYIQGGDIGMRTLSQMATIFPEEVLGFHTNWGIILSPVAIFLQLVGELYPPLVTTQQLYSRMFPTTALFNNILAFTGYMHNQANRPDTVGVSMTESPIGLLSYMLEKFTSFSDDINDTFREDGGLFESYDRNYTINTVMYYWSTNSFTSALRFYADFLSKQEFGLRLDEISTPVPVWFLAAPLELSYQGPVILSLKYKNILGETILDKGGHFFSHQYPDIYAADIFKAVTAFREWHAANNTDTNVH